MLVRRPGRVPLLLVEDLTYDMDPRTDGLSRKAHVIR